MGGSPEGSPQLRAQAQPLAGGVHQEIARDIGQQVEMMILNAKRNSETKVALEIQKMKVKMEAMNDKIKVIADRVNRLDPMNRAILKADLQKSIAKLEEVWEGEVGTLKHELWQTIQAHNHNADLMKHHKDAIDQIQVRMAESAPNPELELIHTQLLQVDKVIQKEQAKQQQIDHFMQRLTLVQQQLSVVGGGAWGGFPASAALGGGLGGGAMSNVGAMPASPQAAQAAAAAQAATGKKAQRKGKAKAAPKSAAGNLAPTLRAEAPEFVPTAATD